MSLTKHLASMTTKTPYHAATQHPFLSEARRGTLSPALLSLWLSQDRLYASHAYPAFIGSLISKIPWSSSHAINSPEQKKNDRLLGMFTFCLTNVVREVNFFAETAKKWDLNLDGWEERKGTRDYIAEMARVASLESLETGLIFLWVMERVYLDAWTYVKGTLEEQRSHDDSGAANTSIERAVGSFAENWTCTEFKKFVQDLADIVDDLGIKEGSEQWERAEGIWSRVVELEEGFWPVVGEETSMHK